MLNKYKDFKIATKLIIGFMIVAIIAGIIGIIGVININSLGKADNKLFVNNTLGLQTIGNAEVDFERIGISVVKASIAAEKNIQDKALTEISGLISSTQEYLNDYQNSIMDPEDQALFDALIPLWRNYQLSVSKTVELINARDFSAVTTLLFGELKTTTDNLQVEFDKLSQYNITLAKTNADNNAQLVKTSMFLMISVAAAGILVAVLLGIMISRLISKPLKVMTADAEKLALGDINITAGTAKIGKDEIGKLTAAFVKMAEGRKLQVRETQRLASGDLTVELTMSSDKDVLNQSLIELIANLNDLVVSIQSSAEQVASGSNLVSNSSMSLSQGATQQASSIQQLTAALQEISSQTVLNAQNAQNANKFAQNAKSEAESGNTEMKSMLSAMEEINSSSRSINKIIKVIDDIAFQTNILALNAAVEAARAGQHGKGFAVVAEEVRTLAARSAQAAKETTDMIEGSILKVEAGTKIATATASALAKIVGEVAKAAQLVEEIAHASNEQASAIDQVNQGILQVSQVVQNNAATSEESAAASEELSSQAEQLRETVSIFKVKPDYISIGSSSSKTNIIGFIPQVRNANRSAANTSRVGTSLREVNFGKY